MSAPTVGIDAGALLGRGGISGYVRPLVETLLALDPELSCRLVLRRPWLRDPAAGALEALAPITRIRLPDRALTLWWDLLARPAPIARALWRELDVFLATCLVAPVLPRGRIVSIVYDLTPLRLPDLFPDHPAFRARIKRLLMRSTAIIAISERTREDLIELMGADPARVSVIHAGTRPGWAPVDAATAAATARRHGIEGPYVLYVGSLGPHKNVTTLLRAFGRARGAGLAAKLALVGSSRWGLDTLALLERLPERRDVVCVGEAPDADLPALYSGAQLFVFPSRYEGFGLPVLEAMSCGAPVLIARGGALPEVAGDAARMVEPDDEAGMAQAMVEIVGDEAIRARMSAASRTRARAFSWERSSRALGTLLREVSGAPRGTFYDEAYFEGRSRQSPPHDRGTIYPLAERTARFLTTRFRPDRVLDVGCAKGFLVEAFLAAGVRRACGVDISQFAVAHATPVARGRLLVADASTGLPFRGGGYDLVTSVDLFEHLRDPRPVLNEIRRVLAPGGIAYLKICHPRHPNAQRDPTHVNVQPLGYWQRQFRSAGFEFKRVWETDLTHERGSGGPLRVLVRRLREWAVIGTPADYKFLLRSPADG